MIVRPVLVTALNLDVGRHMWWPSSLARQTDPEPRRLRRSPRREDAMSGAEEADRSG
jgi:RND superfamily putative drug exporter